MEEVLLRLERIEAKLDRLLDSKPARKAILKPLMDDEVRQSLNHRMVYNGDNIRKVRASFFNWKEGREYDTDHEKYFVVCEELYLNGIDKDFNNPHLTEDLVVNGKFKAHEQSK